MKSKPKLTDSEKIKRFDKIQKEAVEQANWSEETMGENDEHGFWEFVIETTLNP